MEQRISELEGISGASITFATKQLRITAKHPERFLPQIQKICTSIEAEVRVVEPGDAGPGESEASPSQKKPLMLILTGAALFVIGMVLEHGFLLPAAVPAVLFLTAYLLLGGEILLTALKNMIKGSSAARK